MLRFLALLLSLVIAVPAFAETEAETAARTERGVSKSEYARLKTSCVIPKSGGSVHNLPEGVTGHRITLPPMRFLALLTYHPASLPAAKETIEKFHHLPKGGIGRRDYCYSVSLEGVQGSIPYGAIGILGLRLRPDLDVETDYPTAWRQISKARQIVELPRRSYIVIAKLKNAKRMAMLVQKFAADPRIDETLPRLSFRKQLFIPAAQSF